MSYVLDETILDLKGVSKVFPTPGGQPRTVSRAKAVNM